MAGIAHVILTAGALELRPPSADDAIDALAMLQDPDVRQWNPGPSEPTVAAARAWLLRSADWSVGTYAGWSVHDTVEADRYVGNAFLSNIDHNQLDAWVAYRIAPWARGRGVATGCVRAMTAFAFDGLGLERLRLPHAVPNVASCRIAAKAGFGLEGTEVGGYRDEQGVRWDSHVHGLLKAGIVSRT